MWVKNLKSYNTTLLTADGYVIAIASVLVTRNCNYVTIGSQ